MQKTYSSLKNLYNEDYYLSIIKFTTTKVDVIRICNIMHLIFN